MSRMIRICLAQINTTVGDLEGNRDKILSFIQEAEKADCQLVAFPELAITGYPPEDLLYRSQFVIDQKKILHQIAEKIGAMVCVIGYVEHENGRLYNAAAVIQNGKIVTTYKKSALPNYSVFDEERYFDEGRQPLVLNTNVGKIGISICEDIWIKDTVPECEAFCGGAELLLNISASPYHTEKGRERAELLPERASTTRAFVAYCNLVGGQDELVFDGRSQIVGPAGNLIAGGKPFEEDLIICDLDLATVDSFRAEQDYQDRAKDFHSNLEACLVADINLAPFPGTSTEKREDWKSIGRAEEVYKALCLGLHDYIAKNGFKKVTLGLSGGIDSALVAALATDALGKENVVTVSMPSRYSSSGSIDDAKKLAANLGIHFMVLPIEQAFKAYLEILAEPFAGLEPDVTEENIQARIRGNLLMALSNKFGWLVLATGNKSEVSVGYATLYGDMAGGFAPLKDVSKQMVYQLCRYRNEKAGFDLIPREIIEKPPSAELRPDQKDEDSLPPYDILDQILELYVEMEKSVAEIVERGFDEETVRFVARLVDVSEYKRRQAAPGIKITPRAFGKDRRMPITNKYRAR